MKRLIAMAVTVAVLATTTGCGPDWFGNVPEQPKPAADACGIAGKAPADSDVSAELDSNSWKNRPGDVPPGHSWILIGVHVKALDPIVPGVDMNYCVNTYIKITVSTLEGDTAIAGHGTERVYEFDTVTPWTNHYVPFSYDPTEERFKGRPPHYQIKVEAAYVPGDQSDKTPDPREMLCEITIHSGSVASNHWPPTEGRVFCSVDTNTYDRYDQYQP